MAIKESAWNILLCAGAFKWPPESSLVCLFVLLVFTLSSASSVFHTGLFTPCSEEQS